MTENDENKYLRIEREILRVYGFKCGIIIQFLKDNKGQWKGKLNKLAQYLYPFTRTKLRMSIVSLKSRGYITARLDYDYVDMSINDEFKEKKVVVENRSLEDILAISKKIVG